LQAATVTQCLCLDRSEYARCLVQVRGEQDIRERALASAMRTTPQTRDEQHVYPLNRLLETIPVYSSLCQDVKSRVCQALVHVTIPDGAVIGLKHAAPELFMMVLRGTLEALEGSTKEMDELTKKDQPPPPETERDQRVQRGTRAGQKDGHQGRPTEKLQAPVEASDAPGDEESQPVVLGPEEELAKLQKSKRKVERQLAGIEDQLAADGTSVTLDDRVKLVRLRKRQDEIAAQEAELRAKVAGAGDRQAPRWTFAKVVRAHAAFRNDAEEETEVQSAALDQVLGTEEHQVLLRSFCSKLSRSHDLPPGTYLGEQIFAGKEARLEQRFEMTYRASQHVELVMLPWSEFIALQKQVSNRQQEYKESALRRLVPRLKDKSSGSVHRCLQLFMEKPVQKGQVLVERGQVNSEVLLLSEGRAIVRVPGRDRGSKLPATPRGPRRCKPEESDQADKSAATLQSFRGSRWEDCVEVGHMEQGAFMGMSCVTNIPEEFTIVASCRCVVLFSRSQDFVRIPGDCLDAVKELDQKNREWLRQRADELKLTGESLARSLHDGAWRQLRALEHGPQYSVSGSRFLRHKKSSMSSDKTTNLDMIYAVFEDFVPEGYNLQGFSTSGLLNGLRLEAVPKEGQMYDNPAIRQPRPLSYDQNKRLLQLQHARQQCVNRANTYLGAKPPPELQEFEETDVVSPPPRPKTFAKTRKNQPQKVPQPPIKARNLLPASVRPAAAHLQQRLEVIGPDTVIPHTYGPSTAPSKRKLNK